MLAAVRAELLVLRKWPAAWGLLLVMRHRPAVWALVLALPVNMLIISYVTEYVTYLTAGSGAGSVGGVSSAQVLPYLLPSQYLANVLSGFSIYYGVYGPVVFFLLGALVAGSDWARRTLATALLAGPRRVQAQIGQDLAVLLAAAAGVVVAFLLAGAATTALGADLGGSYTLFPPAARIATTAAGALTVALACTAIGLALGTILRSATKAAGVVLLWAVIIQPQLNNLSTQLHGTWLRIYEVLPSAGLNTLVNLYNTTTAYVPGTSLGPPFGVQVSPAIAFLTLGLYIVMPLAIAARITSRRDIT